jgi:hypothetical protein
MSYRYSTIFDQKLPAYIRDDPAYSRFIQFFNAYYEWFDDTYDIYGLGDKLDIDSGFNEFYAYYAQDFLPYFPDIDTIAADKVKLIKIVKELYKAKGVPDSFKFLFRALYNVNAEVVATGQYVLRPSDGKWIVPKSIKIKSLDTNFLHIDNFKVFGVTSKSIGIIEKSKINGKFIQIYLTDIERLFTTGEAIRILDYDNKPVYFLNGEYVPYEKTPPIQSVLLESKIIGSISNINIEPSRRGSYYKIGDPVVLSGGFSNTAVSPVGASAVVSEVTTGQIQNVIITKGGYGYRLFSNSSIDVTTHGILHTTANCIISILNESEQEANVAYISNDCIEDNLNITLGNTYNFSITANANTQLKNCFSFITFPAYPIKAVLVRNGGGGYDVQPSLTFDSLFTANTVNHYKQHLHDLGILAPIEVINPGSGYLSNDIITILGGDGNFAYARINTTNANGAILSAEYYSTANLYGLGGMGYNNANLPTVTVTSNTGSNAQLIIPAILGTGVEYKIETDKIGAITKIALTDNGEDYISTPNVSLRMQDIVITGNNIDQIKSTESMVAYQGTYITPGFIGKIDSLKSLYFDPLTDYQLFSIRIYDFRGNLSTANALFVYDTASSSVIADLTIQSNYTDATFTNGVKLYGDGTAKATAVFANGLIEDAGRYVTTDGQLSAHSVLQSDMYNLSTYILSVEKDYNSYKTVIENLIHPIGTRIVTRNLLKSNSQYNMTTNTVIVTGNTISNVSSLLIQNANSCFSNTISIYTSLDIDQIFTVNTNISIIGPTNFNVYSTISSLDVSNNVLFLENHIQYKFPNVYSGYTQGNTIIITNDNNYNSNKYSMNTFINIGDSISTPNTADEEILNIVDNIIYFTNQLYQSGNSLYPTQITVTKELSSNTITTYTTV